MRVTTIHWQSLTTTLAFIRVALIFLHATSTPLRPATTEHVHIPDAQILRHLILKQPPVAKMDLAFIPVVLH
jgi:hypothetical protein